MRNLARDRRGVALVEFAIVTPTLLLLLIGYLDVVHLARGHLRVQTTAAQIGQIISQCASVASGDEGELVNLARRTLQPFPKNGDRWVMVVTAIGRDASGKPKQNWTMDSRTKNKAAGDVAFTSDGVTLPAGYQLSVGQVMFRTEVVAEVETMLFSKANSLLASLMKPRTPFHNATASVLHTSRAPSTTKLDNKTSAEACLS